jgi:hypothetical protein
MQDNPEIRRTKDDKEHGGKTWRTEEYEKVESRSQSGPELLWSGLMDWSHPARWGLRSSHRTNRSPGPRVPL